MKRALLLFVVLLAAFAANAQSKWKYTLAFGGELKSGNVNIFTYRNDASVVRNDSTLSFDAGYDIVYGRKDSEVYDKSLAVHVKTDLWQYNRWSPFLSLSYLNNKFKGFDYKLSALLGVKYRIYSNKDCDYSLSAAYVQDYTDYGDPTITLMAMVSRMSLRFKMRHAINDYLTIKHTTFWQPSLMSPFASLTDDYIVSSLTTLSSKISQHATIDINFSYEYHSLVPDGVQKRDIITSATLRLSF